MSFDHVGHGVKAELIGGHFSRHVGSAVVFFTVAAIDLGRRQTRFVGWDAIVVQAFSGMQDVLLLNDSFFQSIDHKCEFLRIRLV